MDIKEDFEKLVEEVKKYFIIQLINSTDSEIYIETDGGNIYRLSYNSKTDDYSIHFKSFKIDFCEFFRNHIGEIKIYNRKLANKVQEFRRSLVDIISKSDDVLEVVDGSLGFEVLYVDGKVSLCPSLYLLYQHYGGSKRN